MSLDDVGVWRVTLRYEADCTVCEAYLEVYCDRRDLDHHLERLLGDGAGTITAVKRMESEMPAYAVYRIESNTGSTFCDEDIPERMSLIGACKAVNAVGAYKEVASDLRPEEVAVFRLNTITHFAIEPGRSS